MLDFDEGRWEGKLLHPSDFVVSGDEHPSMEAPRRTRDALPRVPASGRGERLEAVFAP